MRNPLDNLKYPPARLYYVDELARLPRASTQTGIMAGLKECVRKRLQRLHRDVDVLSGSIVLFRNGSDLDRSSPKEEQRCLPGRRIEKR